MSGSDGAAAEGEKVMSRSTTKDWLPVIGEPRDGVKFLPGDDPRPLQRVVIDRVAESLSCGRYWINVALDRVLWGSDQ